MSENVLTALSDRNSYWLFLPLFSSAQSSTAPRRLISQPILSCEYPCRYDWQEQMKALRRKPDSPESANRTPYPGRRGEPRSGAQSPSRAPARNIIPMNNPRKLSGHSAQDRNMLNLQLGLAEGVAAIIVLQCDAICREISPNPLKTRNILSCSEAIACIVLHLIA